MSRKPRDSRCNQNMVPRGWLDPLEEDLSVLMELLDPDCVGRREEGWRGQRLVKERGAVCALIVRGGAYPLASQSALLERK